jgi:hypothetical protein
MSHLKESQKVPQCQMLNLYHPTRMRLLDASMALSALKVTSLPIEFHYHCLSTLSLFHAYASNAIPLYSQQSREIIITHLVESPFCLFSAKHWENNILPDAFVSTKKLHNNSS